MRFVTKESFEVQRGHLVNLRSCRGGGEPTFIRLELSKRINSLDISYLIRPDTTPRAKVAFMKRVQDQ
jgi:hypothetical protein